MQLIELGRGTWSDALAALSCEYAGATAHISSSAAAPSASPLGRSLHRLRYDEGRRELEVSIGLDRGLRALRCFVPDPQRILVAAWKEARTLVVIDASGGRTMIRLAHAGETRDGGPSARESDDGAGPQSPVGESG